MEAFKPRHSKHLNSHSEFTPDILAQQKVDLERDRQCNSEQ
ncbi:hypothetical protein [Myxosarcina sp. GI1(2024)]